MTSQLLLYGGGAALAAAVTAGLVQLVAETIIVARDAARQLSRPRPPWRRPPARP